MRLRRQCLARPRRLRAFHQTFLETSPEIVDDQAAPRPVCLLCAARPREGRRLPLLRRRAGGFAARERAAARPGRTPRPRRAPGVQRAGDDWDAVRDAGLLVEQPRAALRDLPAARTKIG